MIWCKQYCDSSKELTFYAWNDFSCWALPLSIDWRKDIDAVENKFWNFSIRIFCFGFQIEHWNFNLNWRNSK
jgi:hypothetical protein